MVMACSVVRPEFMAQVNNPRLMIVDHTPPATISETTGRVKIPVRGLRGLRFIRSFADGSTASARAGKPSVARLTYRIWTAVSGRGRPSSAEPAISPISPILEESRYIRYFLMLSNTPRPSSTAATIEAKLSSVSIIAAASLVTSVPVMPIAMPMSAFLSDGASFTPSPVIATM